MRRAVLLVLMFVTLPLGIGQAQDDAPEAAVTPLTVTTKEAPPFVMMEDGEPRGLTVDLMTRVAHEMGRPLTWTVTSSVEALLKTVEDKKADVAAAALTVTAEREKVMDFSTPYYTTGLGIAVPTAASPVMAAVRSLFTWRFAQAVGALMLLLFVVGAILWALERRRNAEEFGGNPAEGLAKGFWWSAVTMTTVGYGDKSPRTVGGRAVALVWMFASIIFISGFTAAIASAVTVTRLEGTVRGPEDLPNAHVGTVTDSAAAGHLTDRRLRYRAFETLEKALDALAGGQVDAVVYDAPLLRYRVGQRAEADLAVLEAVFQRQNYALALPSGSTLEEDLDRAVLTVLSQPAWAESLNLWLGERP